MLIPTNMAIKCYQLSGAHSQSLPVTIKPLMNREIDVGLPGVGTSKLTCGGIAVLLFGSAVGGYDRL